MEYYNKISSLHKYTLGPLMKVKGQILYALTDNLLVNQSHVLKANWHPLHKWNHFTAYILITLSEM